MEIPLVAAEAGAPTSQVSQQARCRGHTTAGPWTTEAGWDLQRPDRSPCLPSLGAGTFGTCSRLTSFGSNGRLTLCC